MRNVFTVRRTNSKGQEISKQTAQRLTDLGFEECKEGYFIDLQKLDTKYRMRKQSDKWMYSRSEELAEHKAKIKEIQESGISASKEIPVMDFTTEPKKNKKYNQGCGDLYQVEKIVHINNEIGYIIADKITKPC